ncbi:MAG TPA: hypothetical protein VMK42_14455 [Anaeromyxobacteraceae bacterium]|nr:hypothetical protein [Anaeromyxobacteraceae bacterium]
MNRKNAKSTLKTLSENELSAAAGGKLEGGDYDYDRRRRHHRHHRCEGEGYEYPIVLV